MKTKHNYEQPSVKVVNMPTANQLLAGSTTGMQNYDVENEEEWGDLPLNTLSPMKILELFCMMGLFIISSIITSCSNNDEELLQTSQTEQTSMDVVTLKSIISVC